MSKKEEKPFITSRPLTLIYKLPISKTLPFWEGLKQGKFLTTKCKNCGRLLFPPQADCPSCYSSEMEWVELSKEAELLTATAVMVKPSSFAQEETYIVAVAKLKEGPKAVGWLKGVKPDPAELKEKIKPGMKLKVETVVPKEGSPYYVFVPA